MKVKFAAFILISVLMTVATFPSVESLPGGVGSSTEEYDCGGSCHSSLSTATITMWTPRINVSSGDTVNITVNVTGGQQTPGNPLGVMIISILSPTSGSLPSAEGWTIVKDPGGVTTYNYYEVSSYGGSVSFVWELTAPSTPGVYTLYARTMHGGGDAYAIDNLTGLSIEVSSVSVPELNGFMIPFTVLAIGLVAAWGIRKNTRE